MAKTPKMTEDDLLAYLEAEAGHAFAYASGNVASSRQQAMRDYLRLPYGTEQEGRSQVVASDTFDAVEGMLPDLVEVFVSTDKAVVFDPTGPEDEEAAKQVTNACNHVFYKQNNGFLILYTAGKDALLMRHGGVKWWWEEKRTPNFQTLSGDEMQIAAHLAANPDTEVLSREEAEEDPHLTQAREQVAKFEGQPPEAIPPQVMAMAQQLPPKRFTVRLKTVTTRGKLCVEPIPPDELEVSANHNSILLDDAVYVCHKSRKSLSDLIQMGFDVTVEDVKAAKDEAVTSDREQYDRLHDADPQDNDLNDAMVRGWVREEYVLVDYDGDGIAERRKVTRLGKKILENVEFSHVPIAAWTPYLLTHKFDGQSVWDLVNDFQKIHTDIWRNQMDNLALANNQETVVLTDSQGSPRANIDDLLNRRPGGVIREYAAGAVRPYTERWQGIEAMPMLEMMQGDKEKRTGYSPVVPGLDANALSKTATEVSKNANERQKRMKLMARIMAEALVKPMFRGIFKTLSDYSMEKMAFRLNGSFVQYDPQEWRDGYDMTVNVGIGAGDAMQQTAFLNGIAQMQGMIGQSPYGGVLLDAEKVYNVQVRLAELAGFRNPTEFWNAPKKNPDGSIQMPPPQPPIEIQVEQARGQTQLQIEQQRGQIAMQRQQAELQLQASNDQRDAEREWRKAQMEAQREAQNDQEKMQIERDRIAADVHKSAQDNRTQVVVARISHPAENPDLVVTAEGDLLQKPDPFEVVSQAMTAQGHTIAQALAMLAEHMGRPKTATLSNGKTITVA